MNYQKISKVSIADGVGCRVVLWVSGCEHNCKNCHNPDTHDTLSGQLFDQEAENLLFQYMQPEYINGVTFSGGDPLHPSNREEITRIAKKIKTEFPSKSVWLYTGYIFEQVRDLEVMNYVDVIIDGPYIESQRCVGQFYGSANQRIISLSHK